MSKSLIKKTQLDPNVEDLVSEYGSGYFLPLSFSGATTLETNIYVRITGNQTISGVKNFTTRPTVNGSGIVLAGEIVQTSLPPTVVYTTGDQTIGGIKNFTTRPTFGNIGLATTGEIGGGSTVFDGNRIITRTNINGVTPGGNDVVTFLNNLFYPFTQATVTLNSFPLQELGTSITTINFIGNITPGSLNFGTDINTVTAFSNNIARTPIIPTPSSNNTTFSTGINLGGTITNNVGNCFVRINTKNQAGNVITLDSSPPQTIFFEAPIYAGSGSLNLTGNALNMRNVLSGQTNLTTNNGKALIFEPASRIVNVTTNAFYYFVYPDSWGLLTRIEDTNFDLNFISDFTSGTIQLPLVNNTNHLYRWYRNINQITLNNYGVRYIF